MPKDDLYDVVIIGGGPAGLSAALYAARAALKTLLIEKGPIGGQLAISKEIENYLGFKTISGFDLSEKFLEHVKSYGLEVVEREVVGLDPGLEHHTVRLSNGRAIATHAIILAMGGIPRKLSIPGEDRFLGRGVSYCAKCDGFFFQDQTVVVIGGGESATEEALYLAKIARKVHLIHRGSQLHSVGILRERLLNECNIEVHLNSRVKEINGNDQGVTSVTLSETRSGEESDLPVEGVFIFVGLIPANQLVPSRIERNAEGYILTNDKCETIIPGIYVAGDLRRKFANQIVLAVADGCTAALAASQYIELLRERKHACPMPEMNEAA